MIILRPAVLNPITFFYNKVSSYQKTLEAHGDFYRKNIYRENMKWREAHRKYTGRERVYGKGREEGSKDFNMVFALPLALHII